MTSPAGAQSVLLGSQEPRLSSFPAYVSSAGDEAIELAAMAGLVLDPWQQYVIRHALGERVDGKWAAADVGLVVARQNGKGSVLAARELAGLFLIGEEVIIHSAHEQATASEQFRRLLTLIENVPQFDRRVLKAPRGKGNEAIELRGGQRIFFKTRTSGGGRGFTADCLIYDEAMILPEAFVAAVSPTLAARSLETATGVQTWYTGSAVDQQSNEHGISFARVRERGLTGSDDALAYFEWSAEGEDPARVQIAELSDPAKWAQANPGLGIRIASEYVDRELRQLGPRGFAVERLSIGDWPSTDEDDHRVISLSSWNGLADADSVIADRGVIAFDIAPDRSMATIAGAGLRGDGLIHVGVMSRDRGTSWLVPTLSEFVAAGKPLAVIADPVGPVAAVLPALEAANIAVTLVGAKEYAQACAMIATAVDDRTMRHPGTPELFAAVAGARTKPLGDGWKWSRGKSDADISPLVACTLALWGVSATVAATPEVYDLAEIVERLRAEEAGRPPEPPEPTHSATGFIPLSQMPIRR